MERLGAEIRYATRRLLRTPTFTVATVLTLALALGATAAIFTVVQRVVLNPLPFPDSNRLIVLDHGALGLNMPAGIPMSTGLYQQYLQRARALQGVALYRTEDLTMTGTGQPERIRVARATPSLAAVLRVAPATGRWFSDAEGQPGGQRVAVLSHGLWMRRYGGNSGLVGQSVSLNGRPAEVIGVMPPSFAFPDARVEAWVPEQIGPANDFGFFLYSGVARLADGASLASARTELDTVIADLPNVYPGYSTGVGRNLQLAARPVALKEAQVGRVARALWILLASAGLVLLVACANVANLFLVRSESRQRDVAIRRALGARPAGIAQYFLTESALLSAAGGLLGLALAWGAVRLVVAFGPTNLPRLEELRVDAVAVAFTAVLTFAVALAFGALPMLRRASVAEGLHESGRGNTVSRRRHLGRQLLMGVQIALALVLLASSGLMARSFHQLRRVDPGFDPGSALTFRIGLDGAKYADRRAIVAAHDAILEGLSALPGVQAASATSCLPLAEEGLCFGNPLFVEGRPRPRGALPPAVAFRAVAGGYTEALRLRVLRGRSLERGDIDRGEPAVLVNEALANLYFPGEDPVGRRVASSSRELAWLSIVGIVANTPVTALAEERPTPVLYMPMSIAGGPDIPRARMAGPDTAVMSYVVRTAMPPLTLAPAVREAVRGVDPNVAVAQVRTLEQILDRASAQAAFTMVLLMIASGIALVLSIIGVYGVISYTVVQRTAEIGVRLALGAEPRAISVMIARQGGIVAAAGIAAGGVAALLGNRVLESLLYGVSPRDPVILVSTGVCLLAVALLACWLPARRASRISPVDALRAN